MPGPEQTLKQSINQSINQCTTVLPVVKAWQRGCGVPVVPARFLNRCSNYQPSIYIVIERGVKARSIISGNSSVTAHMPTKHMPIDHKFPFHHHDLSIYSGLASIPPPSANLDFEAFSNITVGYAFEPHIHGLLQQTNNRHLRKIAAQVCKGSHWLRKETWRHKKLARQDRSCLMCAWS